MVQFMGEKFPSIKFTQDDSSSLYNSEGESNYFSDSSSDSDSESD